VSNNRDYKCFIIHLKRARNRKPYVDDIISKLNMTSEIINAVDGKLLTDENILNHYSETPLYSPSYPFKVNKGEVGCFLSFRKAWQKIVDQKLTAGLIFEDDVSLNLDTFNESLTSALKWIDEYGYIQFQVRDIPKNSKSIKSFHGVHLLHPMPTLLRCSAQLVSYSTAKNLLEITKKFDRPVDGLLQLNWDTKINITSITPSGVIDNTYASGGSNLSLNIPLSQKLKQEYNRIKYRYYIKKYTKKYYKI
jgi:glycosyl transferase, family 25